MEKDRLLLISLGVNAHAIELTSLGDVIVKENVNWAGKLIGGKIPVKIAKVYGDMDVSRNGLTSLENSPDEVFGTFVCSNNELTSLKHAPKVCLSFRCQYNPDLMDLEHAPFFIQTISGYFEKTKISEQAKEIYHLACGKKCWNARETWDENMKRLYKNFPLLCSRYTLLEDYFKENRGGVVGEGLGLL